MLEEGSTRVTVYHPCIGKRLCHPKVARLFVPVKRFNPPLRWGCFESIFSQENVLLEKKQLWRCAVYPKWHVLYIYTYQVYFKGKEGKYVLEDMPTGPSFHVHPVLIHTFDAVLIFAAVTVGMVWNGFGECSL